MSVVSTIMQALYLVLLVCAITVLVIQSLEFSLFESRNFHSQVSTDPRTVAIILCFLFSAFSILVITALLCLATRKTFRFSSMERGIGFAMTGLWISLVVVLFLLEPAKVVQASSDGDNQFKIWLALRVFACMTAFLWLIRTLILYSRLVKASLEATSRRPSTTLPSIERPKWQSHPSMSESLNSFAINDKHMNPSTASLRSSRRESQLKYQLPNDTSESQVLKSQQTADGPPDHPVSDIEGGDGQNDKHKHRSFFLNEIHQDREY
ncbi:hypothetical protein INT43_000257 [Umbelopsis isabellina]|uniref:Uncharacterized protein n=1 Tax=Mortierella isabellina TaxID=91625 RepID=A0A8H7PFC0_MORIS|nr:hypothetical protein INT43_000257 [Umbelopsis isabellina]